MLFLCSSSALLRLASPSQKGVGHTSGTLVWGATVHGMPLHPLALAANWAYLRGCDRTATNRETVLNQLSPQGMA